MVDCYMPDSLNEALQICNRCKTIPFAGGTDLMVLRSKQNGTFSGFEKPPLFLGHLSELKHLFRHKQNIHIGAGVTLNTLLDSEIIPQILKTILIRMASNPTRNLATIGGNICNASPAGDTLTYLYAVDATLVLRNTRGTRNISVADFITGPGETNIRQDELLTEIIIPANKFPVNYYKKVGTRKGLSLSKVSFLGLADIQSGNIADIRITFGAVAPRVIHSRKTEQMIVGKSHAEIQSVRDEIIREYSQLIQPIDDARSTKTYRKKVSLRILDYFIQNFICG